MIDIQLLREKLLRLNLPYSAEAGMVEVSEQLQKGLAFFPVGRGLFGDGEDLPKGKIMILGQDFGTLSYTQNLPQSGEDIRTNATWRNLLKLIRDAKISENECFFTNAIMGVREKEEKMTGKSPGMKHEGFRKKCQDFFEFQLETQKAATIWALGMEVMRFLLPLSSELRKKWSRISSLKSLDETSTPLLKSVHFDNTNLLKTNVLILSHPCIWSNLEKRKFNEIKGVDAILEMMRQSLAE